MGPAQAPDGCDGAADRRWAALPPRLARAALIALWLGLALATEWRVGGGGQIDADSHGVVDVVVRDEGWQVALFTDTLDVRWTPEWERGKAWIGARGAGFAAGLLVSPWSDGAPDPGRSLGAAYGGLELGAQRYLPHGMYVGAEGWVREHGFFALDRTEVAVPSPRLVARADAVLGWWRSVAQARLIVGAHLAPGADQVVQPHLGWEAAARPAWPVHPRLELRVGWASGEDDLTKTRLGGLTPYVVPLAGAAWAEWWVEDYAAVRLGPEATVKQVSVGAVADLAVWDDDRTALGLAATGKGRHKGFFAECDVGYAPWIPRRAGISRTSVWFRLGVDGGGKG